MVDFFHGAPNMQASKAIDCTRWSERVCCIGGKLNNLEVTGFSSTNGMSEARHNSITPQLNHAKEAPAVSFAKAFA